MIYDQYEIVDHWIRSLKEEGGKSLVGTIEHSSRVTKELVTSASSEKMTDTNEG